MPDQTYAAEPYLRTNISSASHEIPAYYVTQILLLLLQEPAATSYTEPDKSIPPLIVLIL